jgi:predicted amino acid-binding ACT domain protein
MEGEENLLMFDIFGPDRSGHMMSFSKILLKYDTEIMDMQQFSLHNIRGLHLLLNPPQADSFPDQIIKDLLFECMREKFDLEPWKGSWRHHQCYSES